VGWLERTFLGGALVTRSAALLRSAVMRRDSIRIALLVSAAFLAMSGGCSSGDAGQQNAAPTLESLLLAPGDMPVGKLSGESSAVVEPQLAEAAKLPTGAVVTPSTCADAVRVRPRVIESAQTATAVGDGPGPAEMVTVTVFRGGLAPADARKLWTTCNSIDVVSGQARQRLSVQIQDAPLITGVTDSVGLVHSTTTGMSLDDAWNSSRREIAYFGTVGATHFVVTLAGKAGARLDTDMDADASRVYAVQAQKLLRLKA
jgi:hypothetical protein